MLIPVVLVLVCTTGMPTLFPSCTIPLYPSPALTLPIPLPSSLSLHLSLSSPSSPSSLSSGAWVRAEPAAGVVDVGHTVTLSLHASVAVPETSVHRVLVEQGGLLDLILVVSVEGGGDQFISCSASYVPSCWGLK